MKWIHIEPGQLQEGDLVWIQHKDGPDTTVGYVVLKDSWTFMLNNRPEVYSVANWYIAVLKQK